MNHRPHQSRVEIALPHPSEELYQALFEQATEGLHRRCAGALSRGQPTPLRLDNLRTGETVLKECRLRLLGMRVNRYTQFLKVEEQKTTYFLEILPC